MRARATACLAAIAALTGVLTVGAARPDAPATKPSPTAFECRWAEGPIVIDGSGDDPAWQSAPVIDSFHLPWLGKDSRPAEAGTRSKLLWNREYLYFLANVDDADLFADVTEHNGQTWDNDVFELFFRPAADKPGYFEFQVNAAGTVFDCFFPKRGAGKLADLQKAHTFHVDAKVKLRGTLNKRDDVDQGWTVEGRIPWADFAPAGGRPEPGEKWTFALCRYDYVKGKEPELSTIAPLTKRSFHALEDYAGLTFVGPAGGEKPAAVTTSTVVGSPDPPLPYRVKRVYPHLRPSYPINVKAVPGTDQLFVITEESPYAQSGLVRVKDDPAVRTEDAIKVMDTPEPGVAYDLAFHPRFAENGYFYLGWNGKPAGAKAHHTRVTRFTMLPRPPYTVDLKSAVTVIEWESNGHNGGALCFGTDGLLYVTSGDGTADSDLNLMGQRTDSLLAKVLRIDVDHPGNGKQYTVSVDNPFVGDKRFAPETWAYGLRNPWRIACDSQTGHIWVGNNGQDLWEQVYRVEKGANYGWSLVEGSRPFYPDRTRGPTPIRPPTIDHPHSEARSLTGGVVLHGDQLPGLRGAYVYGDYATGRVWAMRHDGTKPLWHKELAATPLKITAFGLNTRGELLICDHNKAGEGGFYTLEPTLADSSASTFPRTLSASGLFESVRDHRFVPGVVPYSVNAPFWSDGLVKERAVALPPGGRIGYTRERGWEFPDRTVVVKSFAVEDRPGDKASRRWVETRFLTKQGAEWAGYSYRWNDAGTDAELVGAAGQDREITTPAGKQTWHYPSRTECMVCHSRAANYVLGLCELQMNKPCVPGGENQLRMLERLGLIRVEPAEGKAAADQRQPQPSGLLPLPPEKLGRLVDPSSPAEDLTKRARSWLHSNCAACHVEAGGGNARMELEFGTPLDKTRLLNVKPLHHAFDLPDGKLVAPGDPDRSVLLKRAGVRGPHQMPPIGSNRVDEAGAKLLREWIGTLKP